MEEEYYLFRYIVAGDSRVGKTSLIRTFCEEGKFDPKQPTQPTDGISHYYSLRWVDGNTCVKLMITDTPDSSAMNKLTSSTLKDVCCILFFYDPTRKETFENLESQLETARMNNRYPTTIMAVVANKSDSKQMQITSTDGQEWAEA